MTVIRVSDERTLQQGRFGSSCRCGRNGSRRAAIDAARKPRPGRRLWGRRHWRHRCGEHAGAVPRRPLHVHGRGIAGGFSALAAVLGQGRGMLGVMVTAKSKLGAGVVAVAEGTVPTQSVLAVVSNSCVCVAAKVKDSCIPGSLCQIATSPSMLTSTFVHAEVS